eukprot:GHVS01073671.1.p1 GENE.GHVS01073671.1~~GHVS01073671.1.p1  ORF type:complete len:274 (+),score=48.31 GHVS01073671.1:1463-2284(+)
MSSHSPWGLLFLLVLPLMDAAPLFVPRRFAQIKSVEKMWHDSSCFTQGLEFVNSTTMVESCGGYGRSRLQLVTPEQAEVTTRTAVSPSLFLEGVTVADDSVFALTWKAGKILQFSLPALQHVHTYPFPYEGWGLANRRTSAGESTDSFYATDGSQWLRHFRFRPKQTGFVLEEAHEVTCGSSGAVRDLNEIEFVQPHYLFMNVWHTGYVVVYDLKAHACIRLVDVGRDVLQTGAGRGEGVMNGLAAFRDGDDLKLFVTGKMWSDMYAVQIDQL